MKNKEHSQQAPATRPASNHRGNAFRYRTAVIAGTVVHSSTRSGVNQYCRALCLTVTQDGK